MGRTQKDTASYFPHDASASTGDTLTVLQSRYGNDGYAFWFKLLERLTSVNGHYLDLRNPTKWQLFIAKMGVDEKTTVEIIDLLVEIQAIDEELWQSKLVWCQNLVNNLADVYKNRRREIPQKPIITGNNAITTENNGITTADNPQSKVKETKLNEIKEEETKESVSLSKEDVFEVYKKEIMGCPDESVSIPEDIESDIELTIKRFTAAWVHDAILEGVSRKRKDWRYIVGILKNWERYGKDQPEKTRGSKGIDPDKYIRGKYGHMVKR